MTQLVQAAPADAANRTPEIAALNDAARAGTLPTSRIVLTRTQTIMQGAPTCDFRYRMEDEKAAPSP